MIDLLCPLERGGKATVYPGGWSDYAAQRPVAAQETVAKSVASAPKQKQDVKKAEGLTFTEKKRLEALPAIMERLEAEISRLNEFLEQPDLYDKEPVKFRKASEGLAERQTTLAAAEEEWLALAERE